MNNLFYYTICHFGDRLNTLHTRYTRGLKTNEYRLLVDWRVVASRLISEHRMSSLSHSLPQGVAAAVVQSRPTRTIARLDIRPHVPPDLSTATVADTRAIALPYYYQ